MRGCCAARAGGRGPRAEGEEEAKGLSTLALLEFLRGDIPHLREWTDIVGCQWLAWFATKGWVAWIERDGEIVGAVLWRPVDMEKAQQSFELDGYHFVNHAAGETLYIDVCVARDAQARVALWERIREQMGDRDSVAFHRQHQPGKELKVYRWARFNQLIRRGNKG